MVSKLSKKYKSSSNMNSEGASGPWNVVAASTSPETARPWAVPPFQTSNPFKPRDTSSSLAESEPEPDIAKEKQILSAFPSVKQEETPAASAWTTSPVTRTQESMPKSAWTLDATEQVQEAVNKIAVTSFMENTPKYGMMKAAAPVEQAFHDKMIEESVQRDLQRNTLHVEENAMSAWTTSPVIKIASARAKTVSVEHDAQDLLSMEDVVVETPTAEKLIEKKLADEPGYVDRFDPVGEGGKPAAASVNEITIVNKLGDENPAVTCKAWSTASVQHEERACSWTLAPERQEFAKHDAVVKQIAEEPDKETIASVIVEPLVSIALTKEKVKSTTAQDNTFTQKALSASPWTAAKVQNEMKIVVSGQTESKQVAKKQAQTVQSLASVVEESTFIKEVQSSSAWNSSPVLDGGNAVVKVSKLMKKVASVEVEDITAPISNSAAAHEAGKNKLTTFSPWNTTPAQGKATKIVNKADEVVNQFDVKPVQKADSGHQNVKKKTMSNTKDSFKKAVEEASKAVIVDDKIDRKAIANAFEGVASYTADSVVKEKGASCIEATVAKSTEKLGICGAASCSIM